MAPITFSGSSSSHLRVEGFPRGLRVMALLLAMRAASSALVERF